jgi:hypothetical protein
MNQPIILTTTNNQFFKNYIGSSCGSIGFASNTRVNTPQIIGRRHKKDLNNSFLIPKIIPPQKLTTAKGGD